jgi:hypothetical protein
VGCGIISSDSSRLEAGRRCVELSLSGCVRSCVGEDSDVLNEGDRTHRRCTAATSRRIAVPALPRLRSVVDRPLLSNQNECISGRRTELADQSCRVRSSFSKSALLRCIALKGGCFVGYGSVVRIVP